MSRAIRPKPTDRTRAMFTLWSLLLASLPLHPISATHEAIQVSLGKLHVTSFWDLVAGAGLPTQNGWL